MSRLTRVGSFLTAAWLCLVVLVSCSPDPEGGPVVIRYMAWGNPQQLEVEQMLIERFNQRNPHIQVRLFKVPQSAYGNKMVIMLATDTAPDLMRVDHYNFPALVEREYFRPLCDLVAADPDFRKEDFFPQAIQEGMYQGRFYGVNVLFGGIILYYNKTLVQKHGLEDPFELWQRGEWTWERYREHAIAMTTRRPDGRFATFGASMPASVIYPALVWSFGGEIMDSTRTQVLLGEGRGRDMFQFFVDLRYKYHAAPRPSRRTPGDLKRSGGLVRIRDQGVPIMSKGHGTPRITVTIPPNQLVSGWNRGKPLRVRSGASCFCAVPHADPSEEN